MPCAHDEEEDEGQGNWDPCPFEELDEWGREVERFEGSKEEHETDREDDALLPTQDDD